MLTNILTLQERYALAFSTRTEQPNVHVYRDESVPDMYSHNYTEIMSVPSQEWVRAYIEQELRHAKEQQLGHLKLELHPSLPFSEELKSFATQLGFEVNTMLYMLAPLEVADKMAQNPVCSVLRGDSTDVMEAGINCLIASDSVMINPDFAVRKANRKREIYTTGEIIPYVCYVDQEPVGACEWHLHKELVRMEEFFILEAWQRKGLGTELIRVMMQDAKKRGATHMYLTTYADDTPQEMYRKLGFQEVARHLEMTWLKKS
ncbi:GNAT family N-acetyltransferase [Brevibacillus sp. 179-C 1.1 NHS]|uniref:GNAT family N-acetyltransferase n=1 Tax=Brevibacillus sp. 179-C 1.1 NHS TaxID=3235177 RepID=UPI00399FAF4B